MVTPKIECVEGTGKYERFIAEPLERGFGITLGNALRRVLFSSLPGAAVTWVKIEGIEHEFSSIPNVKEDTIEFLLNVKGLRLRPLSDRPGKLTLEVEGEGVVSAADIKPPADFEIANPELYLATLDSPEAKLFVEFNVELGKGYQPAGSTDGLPISVIPVDAIFTPLIKVNYTVEPVRTGQEIKHERLILDVWTDGTISAAEAVSRSAAILNEQFSPFTEVTELSKKKAKEQPLGLLLSAEQYNMPLDQLGLSTRVINSLRRGNITTVGELLERSQDGLPLLRSFGQKAKEEVVERLKTLGIDLSPKEEKVQTEETAQQEETPSLAMAEIKPEAEDSPYEASDIREETQQANIP